MEYNWQNYKMKKTNIVVTLLLGFLVLSSFTLCEMKSNGTPNTSVTTIDSQSNTVFRHKEMFTDRESVEIYCYTDGKCEWFNHGRLHLTCTYTIDGNDIRFLEENGKTAYKGGIYWNNSHSKPLSITIDGVKFWNKNN